MVLGSSPGETGCMLLAPLPAESPGDAIHSPRNSLWQLGKWSRAFVSGALIEHQSHRLAVPTWLLTTQFPALLATVVKLTQHGPRSQASQNSLIRHPYWTGPRASPPENRNFWGTCKVWTTWACWANPLLYSRKCPHSFIPCFLTISPIRRQFHEARKTLSMSSHAT